MDWLRSVSGGAVVCLLLTLGACRQELVSPPALDGPIDYENDPHVLRGSWVGKSEEGVNLTLDVRARSASATGYVSDGTLKLGDQDEVPFLANVEVALKDGTWSPDRQTPVAACDKPVTGQNEFFGRDFSYSVCGSLPSGTPPSFLMTLTDLKNPDSATASSDFLLVRQPDPPAPTFLTEGTIVHIRGVPHTYDGEFVITEDSHAVVQLWFSRALFGDFQAELLAQTTVAPVTGFPIPFRLEGDPEQVFEREGDYYLVVGVFSGDGGASGETFEVGDLTNEVFPFVEKPGASVTVEVVGLEACERGTGGFCVER